MNAPLSPKFGPDALTQALDWLRAQGAKRPVVISGPHRRFVAEVEQALDGVDVRVFDQAQVHVPRATVDAALAAFREHGADAIVTVGGGSATGLGKALRLDVEAPFVAIPTTFAGSEMTRIYGITEGETKKTGREDRVRPDVVAYVPAFLASLPPRITVQSLINALAHPISALSASDLGPQVRARALRAAGGLFRAVVVLSERPTDARARVDAAKAASEAAAILDAHPMGSHHRVAHVLGGRFDLPHAALHSVLLPAFITGLEPGLRSQVLEALPEADPEAALFDALRLVEAPTSLVALNVSVADARAALAEVDGATDWAEPAILGRRPSRFVEWQAWEHGPELSVFGDLATATDVVIAVHGRAATADSIVQRAREIYGDAPGLAVVAPQAENGSWYEASYRTGRAEDAERFTAALATVEAARAWAAGQAPEARLHLLGFSQGSCLAFDVLEGPWATVVLPAGARVGPVEGRPALPESLAGVPVLMGLAREDRWLDLSDVEATAEELRAAGAKLETFFTPGDAHEIGGRLRVRARELVVGRGESPHGFGNAHASEALPGALPLTQNTPRHVRYGLYSEQVSGTGFVAPRHSNQRTWVYRIRPSAGHRPFERLPHATLSEDFAERPPEANLAGWAPLPIPEAPTDFVDGLHTVGGQGRAALRRGFAIHLYVANRSMEHRAFYDSDGDLMLVPERGALTLRTEMGVIDVAPGQIAILPRGIKFSVLLQGDDARGWVGEVFGRHFELPERGVVGANGLADERHFIAPAAWFEDRRHPGFRLTTKLGGQLHQTTLEHSPFDVVAWHGNYTPFVYDLSMFAPVSYVAFDHIDPSAYLVLTAPLDEQGADALDLVAFPARWDPTQHTFRPPFFHRNVITEFNGIVKETAPEGAMFEPGKSFLTPSMTAHGVLSRSSERAIEMSDEQANRPTRTTGEALWFQFETSLQFSLTTWAAKTPLRDPNWPTSWGRYRSFYGPPQTSKASR